MSARNPRYTKAGLDPQEALVIANFIGWQNSVAAATHNGLISPEAALAIVGKAGRDIETLMLDGTLNTENGVEIALSSDNVVFGVMSDYLASTLEILANKMEADTNVASN